MRTVILSFGSNLGDRLQNIMLGIGLVGEECIFIAKSRAYETHPIDCTDDNLFINAIGVFKTSMTPRELLYFIQEVEKKLGRVRLYRHSPRTIDIDIIFYEDEVVNENDLIIPHRDWKDRDFVITPLLDIKNYILEDGVKKILEKREKKFDTFWEI